MFNQWSEDKGFNFFERIIDKKRVSSYQSKYVIVCMDFTLNFKFLFQAVFVPNENNSSKNGSLFPSEITFTWFER